MESFIQQQKKKHPTEEKVNEFKRLFNEFCASKDFIEEYLTSLIEQPQQAIIKQPQINMDEIINNQKKLESYEKHLHSLSKELTKLKQQIPDLHSILLEMRELKTSTNKILKIVSCVDEKINDIKLPSQQPKKKTSTIKQLEYVFHINNVHSGSIFSLI